MKVWLRRWWLAVLMMMLIFVASSTPGDDLPSFGRFDLDFKKAGHMTGYALLSVGYLFGLSNGKTIHRRYWILAILFSGLYAVTDEFHQLFTPGRSSSPMDVLIDTIGAALGATIWMAIKSRRTARSTHV
jgi:VanZ family protein